MNFRKKYLKYKTKYLNLKGGTEATSNNLPNEPDENDDLTQLTINIDLLNGNTIEIIINNTATIEQLKDNILEHTNVEPFNIKIIQLFHDNVDKAEIIEGTIDDNNLEDGITLNGIINSINIEDLKRRLIFQKISIDDHYYDIKEYLNDWDHYLNTDTIDFKLEHDINTFFPILLKSTEPDIYSDTFIFVNSETNRDDIVRNYNKTPDYKDTLHHDGLHRESKRYIMRDANWDDVFVWFNTPVKLTKWQHHQRLKALFDAKEVRDQVRPLLLQQEIEDQEYAERQAKISRQTEIRKRERAERELLEARLEAQQKAERAQQKAEREQQNAERAQKKAQQEADRALLEAQQKAIIAQQDRKIVELNETINKLNKTISELHTQIYTLESQKN